VFEIICRKFTAPAHARKASAGRRSQFALFPAPASVLMAVVCENTNEAITL
jgi:hypothetical protein